MSLRRLPLVLLSATSLLLCAASTPAYAQVQQSIQNNYIQGLKDMTNQLVSAMMQQMSMVGMLFDANQALDTNLDYQRLAAEAHKDYHPSAGMCRVGSFIRSVARTEHKAETDRAILTTMVMNDITSQINSSTAHELDTYMRQRIDHFKKSYCSPSDNNGVLTTMCLHDDGLGAADTARINKDIDYNKTVGQVLTLDVNLSGDNADTLGEDEQDVLMMARHLYWPTAMPTISSQSAKQKEYLLLYARSLLAPQSIALDSFTSLTSLKFSADEGEGAASGWNYMKAMMSEFGVNDDEIHTILGDYPSYYAQMDVLSKKMLQNPDFYTDLYDKPANVERIGAALEAIQLMNMRDYYQSKTRQEMLLSTLLQQKINNVSQAKLLR